MDIIQPVPDNEALCGLRRVIIDDDSWLSLKRQSQLEKVVLVREKTRATTKGFSPCPLLYSFSPLNRPSSKRSPKKHRLVVQETSLRSPASSISPRWVC